MLVKANHNDAFGPKRTFCYLFLHDKVVLNVDKNRLGLLAVDWDPGFLMQPTSTFRCSDAFS